MAAPSHFIKIPRLDQKPKPTQAFKRVHAMHPKGVHYMAFMVFAVDGAGACSATGFYEDFTGGDPAGARLPDELMGYAQYEWLLKRFAK